MIDSDDLWTLTNYDAVGNVTQLITAKSSSVPTNCSSLTPAADCEVTDYEYDEINRLVVETYPDANSRLFAYDKASNLTRRTDQKGDETLYEYSDLYYLTKRDYSFDSDDDFTYDTGGRMLTASRNGWLVTFSYDNANRVISSTQNGQPVSYDYDIPARKRTINYPGGRIITESMDPRNRLQRVDRGAGPLFPITPLSFYDYDLGNRVITRAYENGIQASYSYNNNNWITVLDHTVGATRVAGFAYDYDKEGNKKYEERLHQSNRSEAYQYDDAYRLQEFKVCELIGSTAPVPTTQTQYDLDRVGNWDSKTTDGVVENRTHNTVDEITAIDGVAISHDDNGNLIEDENYKYDYDQENRLLTIVRKTDAKLVSEYQYDALGRRVIKIESPNVTSDETRFFYDDARVIEEQDTTAVTQATYVYGNYIDEVLTMDRDGQVYYYHQNTLWSVVAITDATATVVEQYVYDAYGEVTITDGAGVAIPVNTWGTVHSAIGNSYLFTGRRLDEESGLYYYRARYYDAEKGRFLQRDPLGYVDGMNLYEYAKDNPNNKSDPFGLYTPDKLQDIIVKNSDTPKSKAFVFCTKCDKVVVTMKVRHSFTNPIDINFKATPKPGTSNLKECKCAQCGFVQFVKEAQWQFDNRDHEIVGQTVPSDTPFELISKPSEKVNRVRSFSLHTKINSGNEQIEYRHNLRLLDPTITSMSTNFTTHKQLLILTCNNCFSTHKRQK